MRLEQQELCSAPLVNKTETVKVPFSLILLPQPGYVQYTYYELPQPGYVLCATIARLRGIHVLCATIATQNTRIMCYHSYVKYMYDVLPQPGFEYTLLKMWSCTLYKVFPVQVLLFIQTTQQHVIVLYLPRMQSLFCEKEVVL